jgi:hypothetical protein
LGLKYNTFSKVNLEVSVLACVSYLRPSLMILIRLVQWNSAY